MHAERSAPALDQAKVTLIVEQLFTALNGSALAMFLSMGYKSGLIKTMIQLGPASSAQIADTAGLNERYVREWLGGMVVSGMVEQSARDGLYGVSREHAAVLTGAAGPNVIASHAQNIPWLAGVEPHIVDCFRSGGGLSLSDYPGNTFVPINDPMTDAELLDNRLGAFPEILERLGTGIEVADFGCGDGHFINAMAKAFPSSSFTGYDIVEESLGAAQAEVARWGLPNARFELQDVALIDAPESFDLITAMDAIHDQVKPRTVLQVISRSLRSGGIFLMGDVRAKTNLLDNADVALAPYFFLWSISYCMPLSLAQGGEGLGSMWGEEKAMQYLADAGFSAIDVHRPEGDVINSYFVCRKPV